ncbi:hypothetical protein [Renibacterium salmoninarum]|uniref:hypothetical protein n=1 Tax=Renibacterium salmoninarum TaxID=1646 RepID=UPI0013146C1F|nr:hypothetical protein [Renibacterium salmoninarum]
MRELAKLFLNSSEQIQRAVTQLQPVVQGSRWFGGDAARFRSDWNGRMRPQLSGAGSFLSDSSKNLIKQADEQDKTSSANDGGPGGGVIPPPVDSGTDQTTSDRSAEAAEFDAECFQSRGGEVVE